MLPDRISTARRQLAGIETVADAKDLRDRAKALATWARDSRLGLAEVNEAMTIAILAEYEGAVILRQLERAKPKPTGGRVRDSEYARACAEARLLERTAQRWQEIYRDIPRSEVEAMLADKAARAALDDDEAREEITRRWLERAIREARPPAPVEPVTPEIDEAVRHGDYREQLADIDGLADAVITDPPYDRAFLESDAAGELGEHIARILKPTGYAAVMVGVYYMREWMALLDEDLEYRWTGAYIVQGPRRRLYARAVGSGWKPILLYARPDHGELPFLTDDVFSSPARDKAHHEWGQSEGGLTQLVQRLTPEAGLVCDPFVGGGATASAAAALGRRFVGSDTDPNAVMTARRRLEARKRLKP